MVIFCVGGLFWLDVYSCVQTLHLPIDIVYLSLKHSFFFLFLSGIVAVRITVSKSHKSHRLKKGGSCHLVAQIVYNDTGTTAP